MIALLSMLAMIGIFLAGHAFALHGFAAMVLLGTCAVASGILFAAAETRGFEGRFVKSTADYDIDALRLDINKHELDRGALLGAAPVYVQTEQGIVPMTGVYLVRINAQLSFVLDTEPTAD